MKNHKGQWWMSFVYAKLAKIKTENPDCQLMQLSDKIAHGGEGTTLPTTNDNNNKTNTNYWLNKVCLIDWKVEDAVGEAKIDQSQLWKLALVSDNAGAICTRQTELCEYILSFVFYKFSNRFIYLILVLKILFLLTYFICVFLWEI